MADSDTIEGFGGAARTLDAGVGRADSTLHRYRAAGTSFFVLKQRGRFADIAFDHGRLLAREVEDGVFPEIISTIARSTNLANRLERRIATAVYRAFTQRVLDNVGSEFHDAALAFADGYLSAIASPRFSRQQVLDALVAIEVGNLIDGMARRLTTPFERVGMAAQLAVLALPYLDDAADRAYVEAAEHDAAAQDTMAATLRQLSDRNNRWDFACTGFAVPGTMTDDGRHLHARNLDADLYRWNRSPILFLIDETPGGGRYRYAAFGSAGLLYPGGISGVNEMGLAVSLHQLSSTHFETGFAFGRGDIAPVVQQRLLRDAATLDEAVDLAKATKHFAAWTIFCSHARFDAALRIEINGDRLRVSRCDGRWMAQTNHFLSADMIERTFDTADGHFTPTFGKWLETRARFELVEERLAAAEGTIGTGWAMDMLASGRDQLLSELAVRTGRNPEGPSSLRSYGRVPRKVYGQMATIVRADPGGRAKADEVWMTIGDRQPAPQSTYVGFSVDWQGFDVQPVPASPVRRSVQYENAGLSNWERSLDCYLRARMFECRPTDSNGALLLRAVTDGERQEGRERADDMLSAAIDAAAGDGVLEVPYLYMRARTRHDLGRFDGAKADWDVLRDVWAVQMELPRVAGARWPVQPREMPLLFEYEAGLILVLSALTEDKLTGGTAWPGRKQRLKDGRRLLRQVRERFFGDDGPAHPDLRAWMAIAKELRDDGTSSTPIPEPNFVTVE